MGWEITVHKEMGDPAHVDVSGEMLLGLNWKKDVRWLYDMLVVIGGQDEQSEGKR